MRTTTVTHRTTATADHRSTTVRRLSLVAATLVALTAAAVAPVGAQPAGPGDLADPGAGPDPEVALQAVDRCEPQPGAAYEAAVLGGPDRPFTVRVDWTNTDTHDSGSADGPSGSTDTGEGTVELQAVVTFPEVVDLEGDHHAALVLTSATVQVLVDCPADPGGGDGEDADDGDGDGGASGTELEDVVTGTPTFTG